MELQVLVGIFANGIPESTRTLFAELLLLADIAFPLISVVSN
jgi:hypothetical protein